jgi:cathepsin L
MDNAFKYIEKYQLQTEASYPYVARQGSCKYDNKSLEATVASFKDVAPRSVAQMEAAVANGPVSIAIEAD